MKLKEKFLQKKKRYIILICLLILCIAGCIWQNEDIVVSEYQYVSDEIGDDLDGYRIVQISDLHNKRFGSEQQRIINEIAACNPDLIVVTGDMVDSNRVNIDAAMELIEGVVPFAPVYYVTGNHERWLSVEDYHTLYNRLTQAGVVWLDNESVELSVGDETITLFGLDDANLVDNTLKDLTVGAEDGLWILLAHEPQNLEFYSRAEMDFVFSGHAHGGQVRLPFIGGLVAPDQGLFPEYTAGIYQSEQTTMVVSRGMGNSIIPIRIANRPEIVCVELRSNR